MNKRIAVIGAGLGGLAAACRLAKQGYDVTVYEKNQRAGGKAGQITGDGFRFDTGPSLITMPFVIDDLFEYCGEKTGKYLTLRETDTICRYFFPDGRRINAWSNIDDFAEEIESQTQDEAESIYKYLKYSKKIYDLTADLFLFNSFGKLSNFISFNALKTLFNIHKIDAFRTMHKANSTFFKDPAVVQLFDRYATYNGSDPYQAPATLNIIQHVEYNLGAHIIQGGVYRLPAALRQLALKLGVRIETDSPVNRINIENGRVTGVRVKERDYKYDAVISNADVNYTYENLLGDISSKQARKYRELEPSSSALVFYWGVKGNYHRLANHNILFAENYKKEFDHLFKKLAYYEDPTVYIYVSSKFSPADAPPDHDNWFVMINAPRLTKDNVQPPISKMRELIIEKILLMTEIDLKDKIVFEQVLTPAGIRENSSSSYGSIYGIASNDRNAAFMRQNNRSKKYKGLYFCGGSAHPGGGIPLVLLSGKIAADLLMEKG